MKAERKYKRLKAYTKCLEWYERNCNKTTHIGNGLCVDIPETAGKNWLQIDAETVYPEFGVFEPNKKEHNRYKLEGTWFKNDGERMIVLGLCIAMLNKPL